jgi:excisionase family DNA binding protein
MKPFTPKTLADRWGCSQGHIRELIRAKKIPAFKIGEKLYRISPEVVAGIECTGLGNIAGSTPSSGEKTGKGSGVRFAPMI